MKRKSTSRLRVLAVLMIVGLLFGLPVTASAADGDQNLVIEKRVTAPEGHEALADRYQFTLALWNTDPEETKTARYRVDYYKDSVAAANFVETVWGTGDVDSAIPAPNLSRHTIDGYLAPGSIVAGSATVIAEDEARNVVNVVYAPKPTPTQTASYTVNYFKDSVAPTNHLGSTTGSGTVGSAIPTPDLSLYAPTGYKTPGSIAAGSATTILATEASNVVNVVYFSSEPPPAQTAGYTVNYYKDSVSGTNHLGHTTGSGTVGSAIPTPSLSAYAPPGYTTPGRIAAGSATTISATEANNVVNVVYSPAPPQIYAYRVDYYAQYIGSEGYYFTLIASEPGSGEEGSAIPCDPMLHHPGSTYINSVEVSPPSAVITSNEAGNVISVYYRLKQVRLMPSAPSGMGGGKAATALSASAALHYLQAPATTSAGENRPQPISDECMASLLAAGHDIVKLEDSGGCAMYTFTLAPGQTLDIYGLPYNTGFRVTEVQAVKAGPLDLNYVSVSLAGAGSPNTTKQTASGMLVHTNARAVFRYVRPGTIAVDPDKPTTEGENPGAGTGVGTGTTGNGAGGAGGPVSGLGDLFTRLGDGEIPLGGLAVSGAWSLLNLMLALLGLIAAVVLLVHYFVGIIGRKKPKEEAVQHEVPEMAAGGEEETVTQKIKKRWQVLRWISALAGVIQVLLFLLLEDIRLPMVWVTRWTPLFVVVAIVQLAFLLVFALRGILMHRKDEDEEGDDTTLKGPQRVPS